MMKSNTVSIRTRRSKEEVHFFLLLIENQAVDRLASSFNNFYGVTTKSLQR